MEKKLNKKNCNTNFNNFTYSFNNCFCYII